VFPNGTEKRTPKAPRWHSRLSAAAPDRPSCAAREPSLARRTNSIVETEPEDEAQLAWKNEADVRYTSISRTLTMLEMARS
jgi:hypothetical protein